MKINKTTNDKTLVIEIVGRLDTTTAPEFEAVIKESLDGITSLVLNLGQLEYISSAGLRVILNAQKIMSSKGELVLTNVNETVQEIFDMTGFSSILTIK